MTVLAAALIVYAVSAAVGLPAHRARRVGRFGRLLMAANVVVLGLAGAASVGAGLIASAPALAGIVGAAAAGQLIAELAATRLWGVPAPPVRLT